MKKKRSGYLKMYTMLLVCAAITIIITFSAEKTAIQPDKLVISEQIKAEENNISYEPLPENPVVEEPKEIQEPQEYVFSFISPVEGEIIEEFSNGELVYSMTLNDYRVHNGVDIGCEYLSRVHAAERGTVEKVYEDLLMGKTIIIAHENGYKTVYSNLSSTELVNIDQTVEKGEIISGAGDSAITEQSIQPHLHFEILKDGVYVNPLDFIDK